MTALQKIQLKQSQLRQNLSALLENERRSEEQNTEMNDKTAELRSLENDYQTAVLLDEPQEEIIKETSSEGKEIKEIISKASIADYIGEAKGKSLDGAALELRSAVMPGEDFEGYMPLDILLNGDAEGPLETRADAVTNIGTAIQDQQQNIMGRLFPQGSAAYLGVRNVSVNPGTVTFPRLATGTTAAARVSGAELDGTVATITSKSLNPYRITASYTFSSEDLSLIRGLEDALRSDLRRTISDRIDYLIINGAAAVADTSPAVNGLLTVLTAPSDPSKVVNWEGWLSAYTDAVDGMVAMDETMVRLLVHKEAFKLAKASQIATSGDLLLDRIPATRFRVSANLPDTASTISTGIRYATNSATRGITQVTWRGVEVLVDPYSGAPAGRIRIQMNLMTAIDIIETSAYEILKWKIAP